MSVCQKCRGIHLEKRWCDRCNKTGIEPTSEASGFTDLLCGHCNSTGIVDTHPKTYCSCIKGLMRFEEDRQAIKNRPPEELLAMST